MIIIVGPKIKKKIVWLDNLSGHFHDWVKYKEWRDDDKRSDVIYIDDFTHKNLVLAFFPSRCTAFGQPCDQGAFLSTQQRFRQFLNNQLLEGKQPSKVQLVEKIFELLSSVPAKVLKACWHRCLWDSFKRETCNQQDINDLDTLITTEVEEQGKIDQVEGPHKDSDEVSLLDSLIQEFEIDINNLNIYESDSESE